jgi:putative ABC transport system substrate-binding protein
MVVAAATLPWPLSYALAQRTTAARIGFLGVSTSAKWATRVEALRAGLRDKGYVEGSNLVIEFRFAEGRYARLPELAAELVRSKVDIIVTHTVPGALAAKHATAASRIPVVMTNVADAVGAGIVTNLARPGGNVTGDTFFVPELAAKRIELLRDALPATRRVAVLVNPDNEGTPRAVEAMQSTCRALGIGMHHRDVRGPADLDAAFASIASERVNGLAIVEDIVLIQNHAKIAQAAIRLRLPSIGFVEYADDGGLFGYGADYLALYRGVGEFVDRILKGTPPGDIPIARPTTFELVVNDGTAKAIDLVVPQAILVRLTRRIA